MHGKKLFTGIIFVKGFFLFDIASVHEIEYPFRYCDHALYIRIWKTRALVLGWWKQSSDIDEHLMRSIGGRILYAEK